MFRFSSRAKAAAAAPPVEPKAITAELVTPMATQTSVPSPTAPDATYVVSPPTTPPAFEPSAAPTETNVFEELGISEPEYLRIKEEIHEHVVTTIDLSRLGIMDDNMLRKEIREATEKLLDERKDMQLTPAAREQVISDVIDETFGFGPLEKLLRDSSISDIMINGAKTIYVERKGKIQRSPITFSNDAHLLKIIQRIVGGVGRRVDETSPMVDARLPDGSRVNAIIPPLALDGPLVSIRRFGSKPLRGEDLVKFNAMTPEMLTFLAACARSRLNILISGGTGSGKTTLLNMLSSYISNDERVATIEDAAELQLQQSHVIRMETRPANVEGHGEVSCRDLVRNALRMRPDRIIIGECRGAEALDMLQAMNTGHDGSLTTIHANTPRDAMMRLEMMVGMAGLEIPVWTIRRQIASAVHLVVQSVRLSGGLRKIVAISEVTGMEGDVLSMHDIFVFNKTGVNEQRVAQGYFTTTGVRPHCLERLAAAGQSLPPDLFEQRILGG